MVSRNTIHDTMTSEENKMVPTEQSPTIEEQLKARNAERAAAEAIADEPVQPPEPFLSTTDDDFEPGAVQDHEGYAALRKAVHARVAAYLEPAGAPADMIPQYAELMCEDIERELEKFARGQQEHGGDIRDRDLDEELTQELIDARIYQRCKRLQANHIKMVV